MCITRRYIRITKYKVDLKIEIARFKKTREKMDYVNKLKEKKCSDKRSQIFYLDRILGDLQTVLVILISAKWGITKRNTCKRDIFKTQII